MSQLQELCYIAHERNILNKARHAARYRLQYLVKIDNAIKKKNLEKVPKIWKDKTRLELRSEILKSVSLYSGIKSQVMQHTLKTTKRVRRLLKDLDLRAYYNNGEIYFIFNNVSPYRSTYSVSRDLIEKYAIDYELSLAIEKVLT